MTKLKPIIGKWQAGFSISQGFPFRQKGLRRLDFYILKLKSIPKEGEIIGKEHYTGFWIRFCFLIPFDRV